VCHACGGKFLCYQFLVLNEARDINSNLCWEGGGGGLWPKVAMSTDCIGIQDFYLSSSFGSFILKCTFIKHIMSN